MVDTFDARVLDNGSYQPGLLWVWDGTSWIRKVIKGTAGTALPPGNDVAVTNPTAGRIISLPAFTPAATVVNGISVTFLLDATINLGEAQQAGNTWTIPSRLTDDIADGVHTISALARFANGGSAVSPAVSFTMAKDNISDPGGNGDITSLVSITVPDSSLDLPVVSGNAVRPRCFVDPSLGAVSSVSFAVGNPADYGYSPAVSVGGGFWQMNSTFDSVNYQANLAEAGTEAVRLQTLSDIWYDIQARVVLADSTIRFSPWVRALGRNRNFNGTTPAWDPAKEWEADFSADMAALVRSFNKVGAGPNAGRTFQANGGFYGKELGAGTVVPDPDATNSYGHVPFGNVLLWDVPNTYGAQTAGTKNSFTGGTYGSLGDQATSGSVRGQCNTPTRFFEGDVAYYGYAFRIDPLFPTPTNSHISMGQIYGNSNGGDPSWGIFLMLDGQQKTSEHGDTVANTWQIWGNRFNRFERAKLFQMPFYRGKWVSVVYGVGHSEDARKGWLEIYTAQPGVNGGALTQWTFPHGIQRLNLVTLPTLSDGQPFHTHIYRGLSTNGSPWPDSAATRAHFYGMRTGPNAAAVNPQTYGSAIVYSDSAPPVAGPVGPPGTWAMAFNDDFDGSAIDTTKWNTNEGKTQNGVTNHTANIAVSGSVCTMSLVSSSSGSMLSSGQVDGVGTNHYQLPVGGYAEARVWFPGAGSAVNNWPAWWLVCGSNWPTNGENDIAEGLGGGMTVNYHSASLSHGHTVPGSWVNAWHTFGCHRKASSCDIYYDGVLVDTYATSDPGVGHSLVFNNGNGFGTPVYSGAGSQVLIDWVRAWIPG